MVGGQLLVADARPASLFPLWTSSQKTWSVSLSSRQVIHFRQQLGEKKLRHGHIRLLSGREPGEPFHPSRTPTTRHIPGSSGTGSWI